jgi:large subunit ribosomal protein L23
MSVIDYFKKEDDSKKKADLVEPENLVKQEKVESKKKPAISALPKAKSNDLADLVLVAPHISEKGSLLQENNQYIFRVDKRKNKIEVKQAVESLYKVKVLNVNIINQAPRPKKWRGKTGYRSSYKKAVVTLKAGDKIELAT